MFKVISVLSIASADLIDDIRNSAGIPIRYELSHLIGKKKKMTAIQSKGGKRVPFLIDATNKKLEQKEIIINKYPTTFRISSTE